MTRCRISTLLKTGTPGAYRVIVVSSTTSTLRTVGALTMFCGVVALPLAITAYQRVFGTSEPPFFSYGLASSRRTFRAIQGSEFSVADKSPLIGSRVRSSPAESAQAGSLSALDALGGIAYG
jgi:hypothetical protein